MINLHGTWNYQIGAEGDDNLIPADFKANENLFIMPGTTNENHIGIPLDESNLTEKEQLKCLREHFSFIGVMWYQKEIDIEESFLKERVELFLERVMFESKVYINGVYIGRNSSLSTPHRYMIEDYLKVGKNVITLRINNNDVEHIGEYASAMTIDTQTIWNGVIGTMELRSKPLVDITKIAVFPNRKRKLITIRFTGINVNNETNQSTLRIVAISSQKKHKAVLHTIEIADQMDYEITYKMSGYHSWDEHDPNVYSLHLTLNNHEHVVPVGMREISTKNRQILINDQPAFLIGTLECCIFPLTGYPPTTRPYWEKLFHQVDAYGLNHVRFHSWCPPEVAFEVADAIGIYLQVEAPLWMDRWTNLVIGDDPKHYVYIPEESKRIISEYGNHPSFIIFSNGNELNGDFTLLEDNIRQLKENDKRFLFTLTSNWDRPINQMDDIFIAQTVDGVGIRGQYYHNEMASATNLDFRKGIELREVPIITHEVGQYTVFPNIDEIPKYQGLLEPTNLKRIRKTLDERGLLPLAHKYMLHSGKTSMLLYRDEIESSLRTQNLAGIQLLDLHDFPGQSTADVGMLDCFWDDKGIVSSRRFREFSNRVVPLLVLQKRIFISAEAMDIKIFIANYLPTDLINKIVKLTIESKTFRFEKQLYLDTIHHGNVFEYFDDVITLPVVEDATTLECVLSISDTPYQNRWNIYVLPDEPVDDVLLFTDISDEFLTAIKQGKNMIFNSPLHAVKDAVPGKFFPVFWSPVHFTSDNPNGLIIPHEHPIFNHFRTNDFADYQWKNLLDNSVNMKITSTSITPLIDVIPNFIVAERMTNLFEVQIDNAHIVVTTIDITNHLDYRHEARTLRNSIARYLQSDTLTASNKMTQDEFSALFYTKEEAMAKEKMKGMELGKGKPSCASNSDDDHPAYYGNNGLNYLFWAANDTNKGYYYEIDLEQDKLIYGTKVVFEQAANYLYVIQVSSDGKQYKTVVNQTGQTSTSITREDLFESKGRYVRIVYNGLPNDVRAGHYSFEIYGE